jgi:pimeloyl-ACP methyl ester carboxylesterase
MEPQIQYAKTSDGVSIAYATMGDGEPLILVHGSWTDHHSWDLVAPSFAKRFRVVTYDRRGHSQSECPVGQGTLDQDVSDLATLIEDLGLAPAHVVGNSRGAEIVLRLAAKKPELFLSLSAHEPPLFDLLDGDLALAPLLEEHRGKIAVAVELVTRGDVEEGAHLFVDTALGPDSWAQLPPGDQQTFINNAHTFLDEERDAEVRALDLQSLGRFPRPSLLTAGSRSPPLFLPVVERIAKVIPGAKQHTLEGAGHVPHATHPELLLDAVTTFVEMA